MREFQKGLRGCCERSEFRVVQYSLQREHVHLLVEADSREALGRGMKSVGARLARSVIRVFERAGGVLDGRYHLRLLRTPRDVRTALAYVLLNARRHWFKRFGVPPPERIDEASSGRWFDGWRIGLPPVALDGDPEIAIPRTWLMCVGWRRHGLIDLCEVPGTRAAVGSATAASRQARAHPAGGTHLTASCAPHGSSAPRFPGVGTIGSMRRDGCTAPCRTVFNVGALRGT